MKNLLQKQMACGVGIHWQKLTFILVLSLGLAYAWKHGFLDWVVSNPKETKFESKIPDELYEELNKK